MVLDNEGVECMFVCVCVFCVCVLVSGVSTYVCLCVILRMIFVIVIVFFFFSRTLLNLMCSLISSSCDLHTCLQVKS